jgi:hypothetical protein
MLDAISDDFSVHNVFGRAKPSFFFDFDWWGGLLWSVVIALYVTSRHCSAAGFLFIRSRGCSTAAGDGWTAMDAVFHHSTFLVFPGGVRFVYTT